MSSFSNFTQSGNFESLYDVNEDRALMILRYIDRNFKGNFEHPVYHQLHKYWNKKISREDLISTCLKIYNSHYFESNNPLNFSHDISNILKAQFINSILCCEKAYLSIYHLPQDELVSYLAN